MTDLELTKPKELSIEDIFKDREYIVPIYQRNYAWTWAEIEQLLDDINDIEKNSNYYLGSLIVKEIDNNVYEVIDGQQRLTSLFLLFAYLDNPTITIDSLTFEAREKSNKTLKAIYELRNKESEPIKNRWLSDEIFEGYSIIKKYFDKINKEKEKENGNGEIESTFTKEFIEKISAIKIILTQVPKDIDLNQYFEIMNTRGEQLELHEIVKAKVLSALDTEDSRIAATIWDNCSQMDKYLQTNFSVKYRTELFGENWDTFICKSFKEVIENVNKTEDHIKNNNIAKATFEGKNTLAYILDNPDDAKLVKEDKKDEEDSRFESIISFPNFILQVNKAMNISNNEDDSSLDDKNFIKQLENRWKDKESAEEFIFDLFKYRYIFDKYIIKREYSGKYKIEGKWTLKKYTKNDNESETYKSTFINQNSENNKENIKEINDKIRMLESCLRVTYTSPKTMHWIGKVMTEINSGKGGDAILESLETYCINKVKNSAYKNRRGFAIDHIVFNYLDYLLWRNDTEVNEKERREFKDFEFIYRNSIEHFFPQHPGNSNNDVKIENRDSFGNLALITVSANSKFSNMLPSSKIEIDDIVEQSPKLMKMRDMIKNKDIWNDQTVENHRKEMIYILEEEINKHTNIE